MEKTLKQYVAGVGTLLEGEDGLIIGEPYVINPPLEFEDFCRSLERDGMYEIELPQTPTNLSNYQRGVAIEYWNSPGEGVMVLFVAWADPTPFEAESLKSFLEYVQIIEEEEGQAH